MSDAIISNIIETYGLMGLILLGVCYLVWELAKARGRLEKTVNDLHSQHVKQVAVLYEEQTTRVRALHETYQAQAALERQEYYKRIEQITSNFSKTLDENTSAVRELHDEVQDLRRGLERASKYVT